MAISSHNKWDERGRRSRRDQDEFKDAGGKECTPRQSGYAKRAEVSPSSFDTYSHVVKIDYNMTVIQLMMDVNIIKYMMIILMMNHYYIFIIE